MGRRGKNVGGLGRFLNTMDHAGTSSESLAAKKEALFNELGLVASTGDSTGDAGTEAHPPPPKKRKTTLLTAENEKYDASALVPRYTSEDDVPEHLRKYFAQRYRYFPKYDDGCLLDEEGWYSVTPEAIANQIAERCRCDTVLDAFCGVGGNAIAFARTCSRVIALDTSPVRLALARHNAIIHGVADRIEFILADYLSFARSYLSSPPRERGRIIDVVFLSPPWGGPSYLLASPTKQPSVNPLESESPSEYSLSSILPIHGADLFRLTRQITNNVAYFLPRNVSLHEVSNLILPRCAPESSLGSGHDPDMIPTQRSEKVVTSSTENVEVEEEYLGGKLKALTCYFGGLVQGQEDMFEG